MGKISHSGRLTALARKGIIRQVGTLLGIETTHIKGSWPLVPTVPSPQLPQNYLYRCSGPSQSLNTCWISRKCHTILGSTKDQEMNKVQPRLPRKGKVRKQRGLIYQQMWREFHKWERLYARRVHQGKEKRSRGYNRESGMVPWRSWHFSYTLKIGWDFEGLGKKREKEGHSGRENSMSRDSEKGKWEAG